MLFHQLRSTCTGKNQQLDVPAVILFGSITKKGFTVREGVCHRLDEEGSWVVACTALVVL